MLCGGGKEGDFLSEGMMGLQADVTETSQNPIRARTLDCLLLISVVFYESEPLQHENNRKGLTAVSAGTHTEMILEFNLTRLLHLSRNPVSCFINTAP